VHAEFWLEEKKESYNIEDYDLTKRIIKMGKLGTGLV
jgi:hypothetical protein